MSVFTEAQNGKLTSAKLSAYIQSGGKINDTDPKGAKLSLLTTAVKAGQRDVVELLLDRGADSRKVSGHGCYPLWVAANAKKNRPEIVELLLKHGAKPDDTTDECDNDTPLMVAITQSRDYQVISLLVDAGASLTKQNKQGDTAQQLADDSGDAKIKTAIAPKEQRPLTRPNLITAIVSLLVFVISYVNSGLIQGVKGVIASLYHIRGPATPDLELSKELQEPKTAEEFKTNMDKYIKDSGLGQFFGGNSKFLEQVAQKAVELKKDPTNHLNSPEQIRDLTRLALYQPVLYCDDSGSMVSENRMESQRQLVKRMTKIMTKLTPDDCGVELCFINNPEVKDHQLDEAKIERIMNATDPRGGTKIGTHLKDKILDPLIYEKLDNDQQLDRPYLIATITDGVPDPEPQDTFKKAILECMQKLSDKNYEPEAVRFQISQVGTDSNSEKFLSDLATDKMLKRVLYCTTDRLDDKFKNFQHNDKELESWLLQLLMSPITDRGDV